MGEVLMNWLIVYTGNFIGSLLFLFIYWAGMTHFGSIYDEDVYEPFKTALCSVTYKKINII